MRRFVVPFVLFLSLLFMFTSCDSEAYVSKLNDSDLSSYSDIAIEKASSMISSSSGLSEWLEGDKTSPFSIDSDGNNVSVSYTENAITVEFLINHNSYTVNGNTSIAIIGDSLDSSSNKISIRINEQALEIEDRRILEALSAIWNGNIGEEYASKAIADVSAFVKDETNTELYDWLYYDMSTPFNKGDITASRNGDTVEFVVDYNGTQAKVVFAVDESSGNIDFSNSSIIVNGNEVETGEIPSDIGDSLKGLADSAEAEKTAVTSILSPNFDSTTGTIADFNTIANLSAEVRIPSEINGVPVLAISGKNGEMNTIVTKVVIPDSVTTIGKKAFNSFISLSEVVIPSSVTTIDEYAFTTCSSLEKIVIPDNVAAIGEHAFYGCRSAKELIIWKRSGKHRQRRIWFLYIS